MTSTTSGWRELARSGGLGRFMVLALGTWLHAADTMVTATIIPSIVHGIGGIAYVGWTIALYQVGAIIAGAVTAGFSGKIGVRGCQVTAATLFCAGCLVAATAPVMPVLLAGRLVQGVGGGMMVSLSYVAAQRLFPRELQGRVLAITSMVWSVGSLLGPLIGGLFAQFGSWRWAFGSFAVQAAVLVVLSARMLPEAKEAGEAKPWPVAQLVCLAAATLLIGQAGVAQSALVRAVCGVLGLGVLGFTLVLDGRARAKLLPSGAHRFSGRMGAGMLAIFAFGAGSTGYWAYGPLILKILFGTNPLVSGYVLAAQSVVWGVSTLAVAHLRAAAQVWVIRVGSCCVVLGTSALALAVDTGNVPLMAACVLLAGVGFGISWPWVVQRVIALAAPGEEVLAAATPSTVQRIAYAVGAAATGIAANACGLAEGATAASARAAGFWIFAAFVPLLVAGLVFAWRFTRRAEA